MADRRVHGPGMTCLAATLALAGLLLAVAHLLHG